MSDDYIEMYTDGACSGNPGTAGIGIVLIYKDKIKKISKNIGKGTNNIAELTAIKVGLETIINKKIPVKIYSDSQYCINVLTGQWESKANFKLIDEIKDLISQFSKIEFIKVKAHSKVKYNELANSLAVGAIS